jgi:hypothetical protein
MDVDGNQILAVHGGTSGNYGWDKSGFGLN